MSSDSQSVKNRLLIVDDNALRANISETLDLS